MKKGKRVVACILYGLMEQVTVAFGDFSYEALAMQTWGAAASGAAATYLHSCTSPLESKALQVRFKLATWCRSPFARLMVC